PASPAHAIGLQGFPRPKGLTRFSTPLNLKEDALPGFWHGGDILSLHFTSEVVPMAGLRKPGKRDRNNTVLVIFLAFFVLLSIGLGVWGYFGYSGQKELREKAKEKEVLAQANKIGEQYAMTVAREAALAYGLTVSADDQTLHKNSIDDV